MRPGLPTTTSALLEALDDPRAGEAWAEFVARYRPVLVGFAMRLGLAADDAQAVAQDGLADFAALYRDGRYDRERGRLRSWLFAIAKSRFARHRRASAQRAGDRGESVLAELPADEQTEATWNDEWHRALLREALLRLRSESRMKGDTLRAFLRVVVDGEPPAQVAAELGMPAHSVYMARYRGLERLRRILAKVQQELGH